MITAQLDEDVLYPDSDGKPMADNTEQYKWIVIIKENLEILFADVNYDIIPKNTPLTLNIQ